MLVVFLLLIIWIGIVPLRIVTMLVRLVRVVRMLILGFILMEMVVTRLFILVVEDALVVGLLLKKNCG